MDPSAPRKIGVGPERHGELGTPVASLERCPKYEGTVGRYLDYI